jgi:outer membrane usher protein FimD/PapC
VEGWVVIYSLPTVAGTTVTRNPLDVVGVYTNANGELVLKDAKEYDF